MFQCVFIPLHKVKNMKNTMCYSKVELKLTEFTLLDAHILPTQAQPGGCVCGLPSMCVCHIITRG
jgi:hypothetical protein